MPCHPQRRHQLRSLAPFEGDLEDYERIHKEWLTAMPHVTKINSSFALREVVDRTGLGMKPEMA